MRLRRGTIFVVVAFSCAACKADPVGSGPVEDSGPSALDAIDSDGAFADVAPDVLRDSSGARDDGTDVDTATDVVAEASEVGPDGCPAGTALVAGGSYYQDFVKTTVTVASLCFAKTETTLADYKKCNDDGGCTSDGLSCGVDATWVDLDAGTLDHPINCVSQAQAAAYCAFHGGRLPTFGEFEWAARAGSKGWRFPWGNDPAPDAAHACWSRTTTCSTATFPAGDSPQGLHDLAGGVGEWTSTAYDPAPPEMVLANTSWNDDVASNLEATFYVHAVPDERSTTNGFRCVFTPKP